jgi:AraC-like DNA-binding protein
MFGSFLYNVNVNVTDGGFFRPGKSVNWSMRNHRAEVNKFYFITSGRCEITIEGKTYEAKEGDFFFIPQGTAHSYHNYFGEPFEKYWMHFDLYPKKNILEFFGYDYMISDFDRKKVKELFMRFCEIKSSEIFADKLKLKAIVFELLSVFVKYSTQTVEPSSEKDCGFFGDVFSYIENNLSVRIQIKTLAAISHMHQTHFIRYFKKEIGQTPLEYISQKRMEKAKRLLIDTELRISEIAERLAFYDGMHFSKSFKKKYSISPTA